MPKEYIARDAAIIGLAASSLTPHQIDDAAEAIQLVPAADVVEVVRCCECKHAEPYGLYGLDLKCNKHSGSPKTQLREAICYIELHTPHFFCSDGDRKDGGHDE